MNTVLVVYDIKEQSKIANPSPVLRRYGARITLSAWVFPEHLVPHDYLEKLRSQGADVHLLRFAEADWDKIVALVTREVQRHLRQVHDMTVAKSAKLRFDMAGVSAVVAPEHLGYDWSADVLVDAAKDKAYRRWRAVLARCRREILAAEQCSLGFMIARDVQDTLDGLKHTLAAELDLALAYRAQHKDKKEVASGQMA